MTDPEPAGDSDDPESSRLTPGEIGQLAIPVAIGLGLAMLTRLPLRWFWAFPVAAALGLGIGLLPTKVVRWIAALLVGFGGGVAGMVVEPGLGLGWLLIFPALYALGGHVRDRPERG